MKFNRTVPVVLAISVLLTLSDTASATTLHVQGVKQSGAVTIQESLKSGTSTLLTDTFGYFANTCTASTIKGATSVFTSAAVSGPIASWTFSSCTEEPVVVDAAGSFSIENTVGTTFGTVRSIGAKVTSPSPFGQLTCVTVASPGTDIGTLTGVASGNATMDVNAVLNCGIITAKWTGTYSVTSPTGLGVGP